MLLCISSDEDPTQDRSGWLLKRLEIADDEIKEIFGKDVSQAYGNRIIELVQEQRVEGTIDQDVPEVLPRHKEQALAWLRKNVPFDEDQAIITLLEREEEKSLKPQAQRQGIEGSYAESVLEQIRKHNIERHEKEEKEKEAKAAAEGKPPPLSREQALVHRQQESEARIKKWNDNAKADDLHSVPQMSFVRRVGPATLLTAGMVFLCVMFGQNYTPPSQAARLLPSIAPAVATISVLIAMNCIVWVGWRWLPVRRSMMRMFCLVPAYTYPSSLIGNLFSHQAVRHLLTNMVALWFIGTNLHEDIGRGPFLAVYVGCGVAASYAFLLNTVLLKRWAYVSMGCSGALCALLSTWCCINLDKGIRIWPFPPEVTQSLPPLLALAAFISVDIYGLLRGSKRGKLTPGGSINHVSHLAGYGAGILTAQFLQPSVAQRRKQDRTLMQRTIARVSNNVARHEARISSMLDKQQQQQQHWSLPLHQLGQRGTMGQRLRDFYQSDLTLQAVMPATGRAFARPLAVALQPTELQRLHRAVATGIGSRVEHVQELQSENGRL
ncbi:MAG: hypothetical protein Q9208_008638 [Pyrenodesmia sp. 3 TL-2023]